MKTKTYKYIPNAGCLCGSYKPCFNVIRPDGSQIPNLSEDEAKAIVAAFVPEKRWPDDYALPG